MAKFNFDEAMAFLGQFGGKLESTVSAPSAPEPVQSAEPQLDVDAGLRFLDSLSAPSSVVSDSSPGTAGVRPPVVPPSQGLTAAAQEYRNTLPGSQPTLESVTDPVYLNQEAPAPADTSDNLTRRDGSLKGNGWLGSFPVNGTDDGYMTELSTESDIGPGGTRMLYPLIVPTSTPEEIEYLASGRKPTPEMYKKAESHAISMLMQGKSVWAPGQGPTRMPSQVQQPQPGYVENKQPQGLTTSIPRLMVEQAPEVLNDTKNRFIMGEQSARAGAAGTLANVARSIENAPLSEQSESMPMNYQGYQPKPTGEQRNMPSDWLRGAQDYWNGMASETEKKLLPEFQNSDSIIMQSLLSVPESVPSMIEMYLGGKVMAKGLEPLQINTRVAAAIRSNPALKRNLPTIIKQVREGGIENLAGAVSEGVNAGDAQANELRKQEVELQGMSLKDIKAKYANDPLFESVASRTKDPAEFEKIFKTEKSTWLEENQAQAWADSAIQTAAVAALISGDLGEQFLKKSRVYAAKSLVAAPGNRFVDGVKAIARGANKLAPEAVQEFLQSGIDQANTMIQQPGQAGTDPNAPVKEGIKGALAALVMSGGSEAVAHGSAIIQQRAAENARQAQQQQAAEADVNRWGDNIDEQLAWLDNLGKLSEKGGITAEATKTPFVAEPGAKPVTSESVNAQITEEARKQASAPQETVTPPTRPVDTSEPVSAANQPQPGPGITQKAAEAEVTGKSPEAVKVEQEVIQAATSPENDLPEPTEAQKEAGNYKMGHVKLAGMDISIENPAGSTRSGIDSDGEEWFNDMASHYGYIKGTVGKDKDHIDVFVNPDNPTSETVFVVNQQNPETKEFDEHKVMLGYLDEQDARDAYLENYDASGPDRIASIVSMPMDEFKKWAYSGEAKKGPAEEIAPAEDFKEVSSNGKVQGESQEGVRQGQEVLKKPETGAGQPTAQTQTPETLTPEERYQIKQDIDERHTRLVIDERDDIAFFGKDSDEAKKASKRLRDFEIENASWTGPMSTNANGMPDGRFRYANRPPNGYVREGDKYIFKPKSDTSPKEQTTGTAPAPEKALTAESPKTEATQPKTPETDTSIKNAGVISYEEFSKQYRDAFYQSMKYTPDQAGSNIFSEKMAKLADENPEYLERFEAEEEAAAKQKRDEKLVKAGLKKKQKSTPVEKPSSKVEEPTKQPEPEVSEKLVFHDEYTGPRFTYGLQYRPMQIGAQPKGYIIGSEGKHPDFERFGTIQYPRELTAEEIKSYELKPVTEAKKPAENAKSEVKVESSPEGPTVSVPSKDTPSITPKEQKKYLLAEIDKAIERAGSGMEQIPEPSKYEKEHGISAENRRRNNTIMEANRGKYGTVTIEVPGDGTFELINAKEALTAFKKLAKSFPVGPAKPSNTVNSPNMDESSIPKVPKKRPDDIKELAKIVEPFQSTDKTRRVLGEHHIDGDAHTLAATDGRRLIVVEDVEGKTSKHFYKDSAGNKIEESFPNIKQVIPKYKSFNKIKIADTEKMLRQLRQIAGMLQKDSKSFPLYLFEKDGQLILAFKQPEIGEYRSGDLERANHIGTVNPEFMDNALVAMRKLGNDEVTFYYNEKNDAVVVGGKNAFAIIMQMRGETNLKASLGIKIIGNPKLEKASKELYETTEQRWADLNERIHQFAKGQPREGAIFERLLDDVWQTPAHREAIREHNEKLDDIEKKFEAAKADIKKRAKENKAKKSSKAAEYRIDQESRGEKANIFEMDEGDLSDYFDERFGEQPGSSGGLFAARRGGDFVFPTYEAFRDWMDARYAERDLEGMRMAFAENPTENKVKYVKESMKASPHKKAWVFNIGSGSALPAEDGPVPRTTPRPTPSGRSTPITPPPAGATKKPGQKPPPARPAPPTPPPRAATPYVKFDVMALVQLYKQFSRVPTMNQRLTRALGRLIEGTGAVELKDKLLWDTKLAERVLGHEVGHFVDLLIELKGKGNPFGQRMAPLRNFKNQIGAKKALRNEAKSLSRAWRGNFQNGDPYRDSAAELFADVMSMMFNKPEQVNQDYPLLHDAFKELMAGKPDFKAAYEEISNWLTGKTMTAEWRAQQNAAVEQTIQDLMKEQKRPTTPLMDVFQRTLVSKWYRGERIIRKSGNSLANLANLDLLEYSQSFAAKEDELFRNDYLTQVEPFLKMVHPDMVTARKFMHQYVQARRTIGERRAAGKWIEDNPKEARDMLRKITELDPSLSHRYGAQVRNAADAELYDLAAVMFREIHDRGAPFAERIANLIDKMNLDIEGDAALMAFNVRGKLLNPGGLTVEGAKDVLRELEDELGLERYNDLETAARKLRNLFHKTQRKAFDEGLISRKVWDELIEPNLDNYMPYAVLDYWEGQVNAGISGQKGTAKDIADVTLVAQMKIAALNAWRQKQRSVQLLKDIYENDGQAIPVDHKLERASDILALRSRHGRDDVSRAVFYKDGRPYMVEFPQDVDKSLEKALDSTAFHNHLEWVSGASKLTHQIMQFYTTLNPTFLLVRNPVRGARTAAEGLGAINTIKELTVEGKRAAQIALNYAEAAFGGQLLPETKWFIDQQGLQPPRLSSIMATDLENMEDQLRSGGILGSQVRQMHAADKSTTWGGKAGHKVRKDAEKAFAGYEAFEKIINFYAAKANGMSNEEALAVMRRAGIPKPSIGGQFSGVMELVMPWTRVHIQGIRATLDKLRDPKIGKAFAVRLAAFELAPRLFKFAAGIGIIGAMLGAMGIGGGDDDDSVMAEIYKRISPYKMALDDMIPVVLFDPRTGTYHSFDEFRKGSQIPKHFEVVSLRVASSEEGRLWGPLLYNLMATIPPVSDKLAKPGETMRSSFGNWFINSMLPGASPLYKVPTTLFDMIVNGKNPNDSYRGQPSANSLLFNAGGFARAEAITGYLMNQGGFIGEVLGAIAVNLGMDKRAIQSGSRRESTDQSPFAQNIPVVKSMLSFDNYAEYRDKKNAQLDEEGVRSNSKLMMSPGAQSLYDFYYQNVKQKDKLSPEDKARYEVASKFVSQVWGDMKKGTSFYNRASHAVGPDGTSAERAAVKEQLNAASQPYVEAFTSGKGAPQSIGARYNQQMGGRRNQGYSGPKVGR